MRKKLISWLLSVSILCTLFTVFPMKSYALSTGTLNDRLPIWAYPDANESFPVYKEQACKNKSGTIYKNDYCKITKAYKNSDDKYVLKVTYPTSNGNKSGYVKAVRFIPDAYSGFSAIKKTANSKTYVSTKRGNNKNDGWYISSGDVFYVIERDDNGNSQVIYPINGGYKMGWIKHYNVKYNANGGSNPPASQVKTEGVNLGLSGSKPSREHYSFQSWNTSKDGTGTKYSAGATFKENKGVTLYAQWKKNTHKVTVNCSNSKMGSVNGGGNYGYGTSITISAAANNGYKFVRWNDGSIYPSRKITVNSDVSYTAEFEPMIFNLSTSSSDNRLGYVSGGGSANYGSTAVITAISNPGSYFESWSDGDDSNPRYIEVNGDASFTAMFEQYIYSVSAEIYDLEKNVENDNLGNVSVSGDSFHYGDYVTLTATPSLGKRFVKWNDGITSSIRTVEVTDDVTYTAYFVGDPDTCPHAYGTFIIDTPSTCTVRGVQYRVCSECGNKEYDSLPLAQHDLSDYIIDKPATCEQSGSRHQTCIVCNHAMPSEIIEPLGHDYKEDIIPPTCTVKGSKTLSCKREGCGYTTAEEIRYPGHDYKLSDSSKEGYAILTCAVCNDVIERKLYTFGEDTYSFLNDAKAFARTPKRLNKKIKPVFDIKTFYSVFSDKEQSYADGIYMQDNNRFWDGACLGMSVSSVLFYQKSLKLSDYTNASTVNDIPAPATYLYNGDIYFEQIDGSLMLHLRNMIELFQICQHRDEVNMEFTTNRSSHELGWSKLSDLVSAVKTFVETGEHGVVIRIQGESGQHAIVPVSLKETEKMVEIGVYDNALPDTEYPLVIYKTSDGKYSEFNYGNGRYTQLISYNTVDNIYDLMLGKMAEDVNNNSNLAETLSYARIYTNSDDVTITNSDNIDISTLNDVYRISVADSDNENVNYIVPYGDYTVKNNNMGLEEFEVSVIGPKDTKIANIKDKNSVVNVGIHTNNKSTYVKAKKTKSSASLFSNSSDGASITITNINSDGVRDIVETEAEYIVLDTSNGTLDIASDVDGVILNGDNVEMQKVSVNDENSDKDNTVVTKSGININMSHISSIIKASSTATSDSDSEKITSCQIGAQNVGFSKDAVNNNDYNYTVSVKNNDLFYNNGVVNGSVAFNIYNNSDSSNFGYVLICAYSNDGTLIDTYLQECLLGVNNNYVKVEDVSIPIDFNGDFYIMASMIDIDGIQLSDEVELSLPTEPDYSLRLVSGNMVLEEGNIRGDVQLNVHAKDAAEDMCKAYLCFYNNEGKLLGLYNQNVIINDDNNIVSFTEISIPCSSDKWITKCFLWEDESTLLPLANYVEIPLKEVE